MSERLDEFGDAEVAVVFFDQTDRLDDYRSHHGVPAGVRLLGDPDRSIYDAFQIGRGAWWRVWGIRTVAAYVRSIRGGGAYRRHQGDSLQLGGDVVVDAAGVVRSLWRPDGPAARPSVDDLLAALSEP